MNLEAGAPVGTGVNLIAGFYFVMEIRESERLLLGNKDEPGGMEEKGQVLTNRNVSSLVIDTLCDQAKEHNVAVACFYLDHTVQGEVSPTSMLGALLRQVVNGLEEVPGEIAEAYEDGKK